MSLASFLGSIGTALGGGIGGDPRMIPQALQQIDPNVGFDPRISGPINNVRMPGVIGGFGGGTFDMDGKQVTPVDRFLGPVDAQQTAQPQQQPVARPKKGGGLKDFLGRLGDYLLEANDMAPIYGPRKKEQEQREVSEALAQYIGMRNPELAEIVRRNPEIGFKMLNVEREDKRFDRTAGQDDRRIDVSEGQLGLGYDELAERRRSNQAGEKITTRGQDVSAGTQLRLQQLRMQDASLDRQLRAAIAQNNQQAAMELERMRQANRLEIAQLTRGGADGYEETTVTTEGEPAKNRWFGPDEPAKPATKTVTRKPIQQARQITSEAQYKALRSGETFVGPDGKTYRKP